MELPVAPLLSADEAAKELCGEGEGHDLPGLVGLVDDGRGVEDGRVEDGQGGVVAHVLEQLVHEHLVAAGSVK